MHFGEAVILDTCERPDGVQEVALKAVCPAANYDRLNVVVGSLRVAVPLDRPQRGAAREFKVTMRVTSHLNLGDKVPVEFFFPGEQAGAHCRGMTPVSLDDPLRPPQPHVWKTS